VNDALKDINSAELKWPFNVVTGATITLTANGNTTDYSLPTTVTTIDPTSFFIQPNGTTWAGQELDFIGYDKYRDLYKMDDATIINAASGYSKPNYVFQTLDYSPLKVGFSPVADQAYVVEYTYWQSPSDLSAHDDTITVPDRFNHVVVDGAMFYAYKFRDNETEAQTQWKKFQDGIYKMRTELINRFSEMTNDTLPHGGYVR
jgi:hypothetical protein